MCGEPLAPQIHRPRQSLEIGYPVSQLHAQGAAQLWEIKRLQLSRRVGPLRGPVSVYT